MKISVNTALQQNEIVELLNGKEISGVHFTHVKSQGMNIYFEVDTDDSDLAIKLAKSTIKSAPFGSAILLTVNSVK